MCCQLHGSLSVILSILHNRFTEENALFILSTLPVVAVASATSAVDQTLDLSSQSVEIITREESVMLQLEVMAAGDTASQAASHAGTGKTVQLVAPVGGRCQISAESSPETEDTHGGDAFMTADFYIDESMPSSVTEMVSSKKVC